MQGGGVQPFSGFKDLKSSLSGRLDSVEAKRVVA